jgi:hypothetical protein
MSWSFNPFTGNLDIVGGGAVVFEGEVETFAELPETVGNPAVGASYLVRSSTGVWLVSRKQAGIWIRRYDTGVRATDWEYGGDYPVNSVNGQTGNVSLTAANVGAGWALVVSGQFITGNTLLSAGRNRRITLSVVATSNVDLPYANNVDGDVVTLVQGATGQATATIRRATNMSGGTPSSYETMATLTTVGQSFTFVSDGTPTGWSVRSVDTHTHTGSQVNVGTTANLPLKTGTNGVIEAGAFGTSAGQFAEGNHTHAASAITSGVLDNALVNFAAPAAIGNTTPAAGSFTNLSASAELTVPAVTPASPSAGDIYRVTDTIRYRDSGNAERLLLNATDNLANLSNTATARTNLGLGTFATANAATPPAIGNTTPAAGSFTTLTANNGTLTGASAPVLDLAQTWNAGGTTFTALRVNVTDTASATASELLGLQVGSNRRLAINKAGDFLFKDNTAGLTANPVIFDFGSNQYWIHFRFSGTNRFTFQQNSVFTIDGGSLEVRPDGVGRESGKGQVLFNTGATATEDSVILNGRTVFPSSNVAIRNGTTGQEFRVYNTHTSATNHERGYLKWNANVFQIGTEKGSGGGTARALEFQTDGTTRMTISDAGAISLATGLAFAFAGRVALSPIAQGSLRILGTDGSTFNFLFLGVNSASYPALKRSSAILQVRLGDDSAYTTIDALHRLQGTAPATTGATGTAGDIRYDADYIYVCTAANTWKRAAIATW